MKSPWPRLHSRESSQDSNPTAGKARKARELRFGEKKSPRKDRVFRIEVRKFELQVLTNPIAELEHVSYPVGQDQRSVGCSMCVAFIAVSFRGQSHSIACHTVGILVGDSAEENTSAAIFGRNRLGPNKAVYLTARHSVAREAGQAESARATLNRPPETASSASSAAAGTPTRSGRMSACCLCTLELQGSTSPVG